MCACVTLDGVNKSREEKEENNTVLLEEYGTLRGVDGRGIVSETGSAGG